MLISNGGGHVGGKLGRVIRGMVASMVVRQQAKPTVKTTNRDDLATIAELVESGELTPVIDQSYPLADTAAAIRHVGTGRARGTLVISIAGPVAGPTGRAGTGGATIPRPMAGVA